jgi:hypothetical protein
MRPFSLPQRLSLALPLALILGLLLAGCGGSSSASGTPTPKQSPTATPHPPTPATGFSLYTSTDGVYALTYPSNWSGVEENGAESGLTVQHGVSFISPQKTDNLQLQPLNQSVAAADYGTFVQGFAVALGATNVSPGKADPIVTKTTPIGAFNWTELDGSLTLGGKDYTIRQFGTPHHGATVLVIALAPTATFSQLYNDAFKPMLASITFFK